MPPSDPTAPTGRYVLESQLGLGGMGVVHVALDTHLDRRVALKVVSSQLAGSAEFRERFQREAATLARLDSPHIIAIYDHGEQDGVPFLATQLVRGGDLGDLLARRGRLDPGAAVTVCAQLAEALSDAHRVGIVHRDLKPSNVLVRDPDAHRLHVYLCDFGIAVDQTSDRLTTAGGVVGTWAYLSPERTQGDPATPSADLYALGCLLWVCLTGEAPYVGTDVRVAMAHVAAPVRQLAGDAPHVRHLNEVLARTMAKDPSQRYPDAAAVRAALEATPPAGPEPLVPVPVPGAPRPPTVPAPTSARPTSPPPSTPPPPAPPAAGAWPPPSPSYAAPSGPPAGRSRRGPLVAAAAAVAVLVVLGVVLGLTLGGDPERADSDPATSVPVTGPTSAPTSDPTSDATSDPAATGGPDPQRAVDASVGGDLDGDGLGDVVATFVDGASGTPVGYRYTSTGTTFTVSDDTDEVYPVVGDLDGDGVDDTVTPTVLGGGEVRLSSSLAPLDDTVVRGIDVERDLPFVDALVGDVNGDGDNDLLLWGQSGPRTVTVWALLDDGGTLADPTVWLELEQSHVNATSMSLADYDDDGAADLLVVLPTGQVDFAGASTVYVGAKGTRLYSSDRAGFSATGPLTEDSVLSTTGFLQPGDYTGDGTPLVAVSDPDGLGVSFFDVTADGLESRPLLHVDLGRSTFVATARFVPSDVDGDGDDDVVVTRRASKRLYQDVQVAIAEGDRFDTPTVWAPAPPPCAQRDTTCSLSFASTS